MPKLRFGLIQFNSLVGDPQGNAERLETLIRARAHEADCFVSPEMALLGYPPRDLLSQLRLLEFEKAALAKLQNLSEELGNVLIIGHSRRNSRNELENALSVFDSGVVAGSIAKTRLPSYDVFDDTRFFSPAPPDQNQVFNIRGLKLGLTICEDAWDTVHAFGFRDVRSYKKTEAPLSKMEAAEIVLCVSASPYSQAKRALREDLFSAIARRLQKPLLYVNSVGGQDDVLFDGASFALNAQGEMTAQAKVFEEDLIVVNLNEKPLSSPPSPPSDWGDLKKALVMGMRDYVLKSKGQKVVLGLSGGVDSALCAALAADALGPKNVLGVSMPSVISSDLSKSLAMKLAKNLGIAFREIPIAPLVEKSCKQFSLKSEGLPYENLQARIRGLCLMSISNNEGFFVLSTANKSESSMGYATLYGDMCGALAPLGDLYKTEVYGLAYSYPQIPLETLLRAPTAELAPHQKDCDSLPSYEVLDVVLRDLIENQGQTRAKEEGWAKLLGPQHSVESIREKIHASEFKRFQSAPLLRVHARSFGSSWRMPLAKNAKL